MQLFVITASGDFGLFQFLVLKQWLVLSSKLTDEILIAETFKGWMAEKLFIKKL